MLTEISIFILRIQIILNHPEEDGEKRLFVKHVFSSPKIYQMWYRPVTSLKQVEDVSATVVRSRSFDTQNITAVVCAGFYIVLTFEKMKTSL